MTTASVPGKLYVAGEYAVIEPGHQGLLVAVDRFLTVEATPHDRPGGRIISGLRRPPRQWYRGSGTAHALDGRTDYVLSAIRVVDRLVQEAGIRPRCFDLRITSELNDASGRKLGLGSSAAVTVATVRSLLDLYNLEVGDLGVYQLALLASDDVDQVGSGGDLAASTFTGWVAYRSPDRHWVRRARTTVTLTDLLATTWPGLEVRKVGAPSDMDLLVGWTGRPASTTGLVSHVRSATRSRATAGREDQEIFLAGSEKVVGQLISALAHADHAAVMESVARARALLAGLADRTGVVIEAPALTRLITIALEHGASAKTSGAGGGDCGIALCPPGTDTQALREAWRAQGIEPLDLNVHDKEAP